MFTLGLILTPFGVAIPDEKPLTHDELVRILKEGKEFTPGTFESMTKSLSRSEIDLLQEYQQQFPKIRDFYTNVAIHAVEKYCYGPTNEPESVFSSETTYYSHGFDMLRIDKLIVSSNQKSDTKYCPPLGSRQAFLAYDEGVIHAASEDSDGPLVAPICPDLPIC